MFQEIAASYFEPVTRAPKWLIVISLIALWPVGLLLLWTNKALDKPRKKKWTFVWLGCWVVFVVIYGPFWFIGQSKYKENMRQAESQGFSPF